MAELTLEQINRANQRPEYTSVGGTMVPISDTRQEIQSAGGTTNKVTPNAYLGTTYESNMQMQKPVSYLSTDNAARTVDEGVNKLNELNAINAQKKETVDTTTTKPKVYFANENNQEAEFTQDQLDSTTQKWLQDNGYVQTKTEFATATEEYNKANKELDDLRNDVLSYNVETDPEFAPIAAGISSQFDKLRKETEKANASRASALSTLGMRGGTTEFAGEIQLGIEGEELKQATERIAEINRQEQEAIAAAQAAYKNGKYTEFNNKMAIIEAKRNEKASELQSYNEKLASMTKSIQETTQRAERDSVIANLIEQGVTDPVEMMNYLNYDENGRLVGDFTAKEISDTLTSLSKSTGMSTDKLTGESKNYFILKNIPGALPSGIKDLGSYLTWQKNITTSKAAQDAGNGYGGFDKFSAESIALSVIPATLRNSEVELKRFLQGIELGIEEGLTPYQVADALMGYRIENPDAFSDGFRQTIALANLNGQEIGNMARLINSGNKEAAIAYTENKILENQKRIDPDGYQGEATPRYYVEKVAEIKKVIEDAGLWDAIGPLEGTWQNVLGKLKGKEAAVVKSKVTSLVQDMRKYYSGSAVTPSEEKFLEPLLASLSDKKGNFIQKLDEISTNSLTKYNNTRKAAGLPQLTDEQLINRNERIKMYEGGFTTSDNTIDKQIESEKALNSYLQKNPAKIQEVGDLISKTEERLGREITAEEFYQLYPSYK